MQKTSEWISGMFDHIPVQYYFAEIEESKHTNRKYRTEPIELVVDIEEITKRELSAEGHMTVSQYNAIKLLHKSDQSETIKQFMEEDDIGDITKNPTDELRERLHAKIEEVTKGRGNPQTHQKSGNLPESKKHQKRSKEQKDSKSSEMKEKTEEVKSAEKKGKQSQKKGNGKKDMKDSKEMKDMKKNGKQSQKKGKKDDIVPFVRPTMTSPELKDNLDFGTITWSNTGKTVPRYLTKKQKK